jgi:hypothetical protein
MPFKHPGAETSSRQASKHAQNIRSRVAMTIKPTRYHPARSAAIRARSADPAQSLRVIDLKSACCEIAEYKLRVYGDVARTIGAELLVLARFLES